MSTPFDALIADIQQAGYHNHRLERHSDVLSYGIVADLRHCDVVVADLEAGVVQSWLNIVAPGERERKIDLFIGEPKERFYPDIQKVRICAEHKSIVTAHRNRGSRFSDLNETLQVVHAAKKEAVIVATVLIGVAKAVLNIPDQVKKRFSKEEFNRRIVPRLSRGDESLWDEFSWAISYNTRNDPMITVDRFRKLPTRPPGLTHVPGYDFVLLVPVHIDNVNPPRLADGAMGIDIQAEYDRMIDTICRAYRARWHV